MSTTPSTDELLSALQVIRALSDPRMSDHGSALSALPEMTQRCDFVVLMLHVFACGGQYGAYGVTVEWRQLAGMLIKNYSVKLFSQEIFGGPSGMLVNTLQESVLMSLIDESQEIRKTSASILGRIAQAYTHDYWSGIAPNLISVLLAHSMHPPEQQPSSLLTTAFALDGAMRAIVILCEDASAKLAMDPARPLETIVPLVISMFAHSSDTIRLYAVTALNALIASGERDFLFRHMSQFLIGLGSLTADPLSAVRRAVCSALVLIATTSIETLEPCFHDVCAFMMNAIRDADESVAIEACEFWLALLDEPRVHSNLLHQLGILVPSCMSRLRLTQAQVDREREDEEEKANGSKLVRFHSAPRGGSDEEDLEYTIRKQCAFLLENLAVAFPNGTLPLAAPLIWSCIQNDQVDSWEREAAMLSLYAIAKGCGDLLHPNFGSIVPHIMGALQDQLQETRAIACWCLSKYADWVQTLLDQNEALGQAALNSFIQGLLTCLTDSQPKVQASACSSLVSLLVAVDPASLLPYTEQILIQISLAWPHYGVKNRMLLMDTIGELCASVGPEMNHAHITSLYLPYIMSFLQEHSSTDFESEDIYLVIPPLECLANLFRNVPQQVLPIAQVTTCFCLQIIHQYVNSTGRGGGGRGARAGVFDQAALDNDADIDEDDEVVEDEHTTDVVVASIQLISSTIEGLKGSSTGLLLLPSHPQAAIAGSAPPMTISETLRDLILQCICDPHITVRQTTLALIGELSSYVPSLLFPSQAQHIFNSIFAALATTDDDFGDAEALNELKNNAVWASGLIAMCMGGEAMAAYLPHLMNSLVQTVYSLDENQGGSGAEEEDDTLLLKVRRRVKYPLP